MMYLTDLHSQAILTKICSFVQSLTQKSHSNLGTLYKYANKLSVVAHAWETEARDHKFVPSLGNSETLSKTYLKTKK